MSYQIDILKEFVIKLSENDKSIQELKTESWRQSNEAYSKDLNFEHGYSKLKAQITIEARKILSKCEARESFPYRKRPAKDLVYARGAKSEVVIMGELPEVPGILDDPLVSLVDLEREHIIRVLKVFGYNKTKSAKSLGISLKGLYNKLKVYKIETPPLVLRNRPGRKPDLKALSEEY